MKRESTGNGCGVKSKLWKENERNKRDYSLRLLRFYAPLSFAYIVSRYVQIVRSLRPPSFKPLQRNYTLVRIIAASRCPWAKSSSRVLKSTVRIVSLCLSVICRQIVVSPFCYVLSSCPLDALAMTMIYIIVCCESCTYQPGLVLFMFARLALYVSILSNLSYSERPSILHERWPYCAPLAWTTVAFFFIIISSFFFYILYMYTIRTRE